MAHADYACCIICDSETHYEVDSYSKTDICQRCAAGISLEVGKVIGSVDEFLQWFRSEEERDVIAIIDGLGYKPCYYENTFDSRVKNIRDLEIR